MKAGVLQNEERIIQTAETFVQKQLGEDATGHDWFHVDRVRRNALHICKQEAKGDPLLLNWPALLHDIPDEKLNETIEIGQEKLDSFLQTLRLPFEQMHHINQIIRIHFL